MFYKILLFSVKPQHESAMGIYIFNDCYFSEKYLNSWLLMLFSHAQHFATPWTAAPQPSLSFTITQSLLKLMSIESVMPSNHLTLCFPLLLLPQSFPASGFSPVSWHFSSVDQRCGASASASVLSTTI